MHFKSIITVLLLINSIGVMKAQNDTLMVDEAEKVSYHFLMNDGGDFIGTIISEDEREVYIQTDEGATIYLPLYAIKERTLVEAKDFNAKGDYIGEDAFATRYFITTNGLPIKKGEHYIQWNWYGPDFEFGVGENLGVGVMTSWVGIPIIGTIKKSWQVGESTQFAVGTLLGTGSWALPGTGGVLPYGTVSFGNRRHNIAFSGGYAAIWDEGDTYGRATASVAFMLKVSQKISVVFDSFFVIKGKPSDETYGYYNGYDYEEYEQTNDKPAVNILIPGIRWHNKNGSAIQIGFSNVISEGEVYPIPMFQWYVTL